MTDRLSTGHAISKGTYKRKLEWAREGFAAAMAVVLGEP